MKISFKKISDFFSDAGSFWMRHVRFSFFLLLLIVFCFSIFEWKIMVYAPKDQSEKLKQSILQSEEKGLNMNEFEGVVKAIEDREELPISRAGRDIFYQ